MGILTFILTVAAGLVATILAEEYRAGAPSVAKRLIGNAVLSLPQERRDEYLSEWLALLEELPTPSAKLVNALSLWWSVEQISVSLTGSRITRRSVLRTRFLETSIALAGVWALLPLFAILTLMIRITVSKQALVTIKRQRPDGGIAYLYHFNAGDAATRRTNPFARFVYSTSMDELALLFNVVRGDISMVGVPPAPIGTPLDLQYTELPMGMCRDPSVPTAIFSEDLRRNYGIRFVVRTIYRVVRNEIRGRKQDRT